MTRKEAQVDSGGAGMATVLVVMARVPEPGAVKTRLAATIGAEPACALYRAFLHDIDRRFATGRRRLVWAHFPGDADWSSVIGAARWSLPQAGATLGERMHHCFRELCGGPLPAARGVVGRVIMIGADVPHVTEACLAEAEEKLSEADVVLGPSDDGGYYLVAMREAHDIFTGIPMGTARVFEETRARVRERGLRLHTLARGFDIDEETDLPRLRELLAADRSLQLPHTAALLQEWEITRPRRSRKAVRQQ